MTATAGTYALVVDGHTFTITSVAGVKLTKTDVTIAVSGGQATDTRTTTYSLQTSGASPIVLGTKVVSGEPTAPNAITASDITIAITKEAKEQIE